MQAEFTLLKQMNGRGHYARVIVEAEPRENVVSVMAEIGEAIDDARGEVDWKTAPEWLEAALRGAAMCAENLVRQARISGCLVRVNRVFGRVVDTTEEDLFCAGAVATWQALIPHSELPPFEFIENKWRIHF